MIFNLPVISCLQVSAHRQTNHANALRDHTTFIKHVSISALLLEAPAVAHLALSYKRQSLCSQCVKQART